MKKNILYFLLLCAGILSCSKQLDLAGGTTSTPNERIAGVACYANGKPATHARVILRRSDYVADTAGSSQQQKAQTMTDDKGIFVLDSIDSGHYCIEINDGNKNAVAVTAVMNQNGDPVELETITLRPVGTISGHYSLAPRDSFPVYIQIMGLERLYKSTMSSDTFSIDVPEGTYTLRSVVGSSLYSAKTISGIMVASAMITTVDSLAPAKFGAWGHSKPLSINTSTTGAAVMGNVFGFQLLVRLNSSNFDFSQAQSNGGDIRFAKQDNTPLAYEIEQWNSSSQRAEIWVKIDTVFGNNNRQSIMVYWGNSTASSESSGPAVFDTSSSEGGFQGVWHMGQAGNTMAKDASKNGYDGTPFNMSAACAVEGMIGTAQEFDGATSYIRMLNTSGGKMNFVENGYYSVSAWVNCDTSAITQFVAGKGHEQYYLKFNLSIGWEFVEWKDNIGPQITSTSVAEIKQWRYLVGVRNGTTQRLYVDGVCIDSTISIFSDTLPRSSQSDFSIGAYLSYINSAAEEGYAFFKGKIDEVRVSSVPYTSDRIKLNYSNQKDADILVIF